MGICYSSDEKAYGNIEKPQTNNEKNCVCKDVNKEIVLTDSRFEEIVEVLNNLKKSSNDIKRILYRKVSMIVSEFPVCGEERKSIDDFSFLNQTINDLYILSDSLAEIGNIIEHI